jgi:transglutaminase-like putative cysteine protease
MLANVSLARAESDYSLDLGEVHKGIFTLNYDIADKKAKLMVQKGGTTLYYNLVNGITSETFPLQLGNGSYTIAVLENTAGDKYRIVFQEMIRLQQKSSMSVYLQSIQAIKWDQESEAVKKAKELTQDIQGDEQKIKTIYEYLIKNYSFDYEVLDSLSHDYLPDIEKTFRSKKGICYDFSSLFASMLRSIGIPAKLVKGYGDKVEGYHAWNEVYLQDTEQWLLIDTSYDAQMHSFNRAYSVYKDKNSYTKYVEL